MTLHAPSAAAPPGPLQRGFSGRMVGGGMPSCLRAAASPFGRFARLLLMTMLVAAFTARPALAQDDGVQVLRDTETEAFLRDISLPLAKAAGLDTSKVQVILVSDQTINAGATQGQLVAVNAGTIFAADNVLELQGVIAHEFGHLAGGHVPLAADNYGKFGKVSLLSLLAGAAAIAAGAGGAGMAIMGAGTQLAERDALAFSRAQEASADAAGVNYLKASHLSGSGMLSFFGKLKNEEYRLMPAQGTIDPFAQDHPMSADRQMTLEQDVKSSPYYKVPEDPALHARFLRIKAKLQGYLLDPTTVMRKFPESDQTVPGHYARAYAWHRSAYPDKADAEADALLRTAPTDPYFNELKGQILLENGHPKQALAPLRIAVDQSGHAPLISAMLGHALLATDDTANFPEAERVLKVSVDKDREDPLAWYALGTVYAARGDESRAALATAERYAMNGQDELARMNAQTALRGLKIGTPEYLRAEDIAVTSRNNMDQRARKKR
jgi:predicted Zn-dependent protease